jgi:hypothetical protein
MSEPENFLTRWSRRKRVAGAAPEQPPTANEAGPETPFQGEEPGGEKIPPLAAAPASSEAPAPAFDPASLPSLDSIDAQTDIRAFLQAGVPNDLKLAALRRAWSTDPAIRDFKGLAENDWDFNDPNGIMGFGKLDPGTDVKKMLAQLFGETVRETEPARSIPARPEQPGSPALDPSVAANQAAPDLQIPEPSQNEPVRNEVMWQRERDISARDGNTEGGVQPDDRQVKHRRSQGGALPH